MTPFATMARRARRAPACAAATAAVIVALCPLLAAATTPATGDKPNIVFVLTDDQDHMLGGSSSGPLPNAGPALARAGVTASNWFVHTPVCCPSRSEIISGRFFHNLAWAATPGNRWDTTDGVHARQCMHIQESRLSPGPTFAGHLAAAGYRVGFFGKYLNISPRRAPTGAHTYAAPPPASATGRRCRALPPRAQPA